MSTIKFIIIIILLIIIIITSYFLIKIFKNTVKYNDIILIKNIKTNQYLSWCTPPKKIDNIFSRRLGVINTPNINSHWKLQNINKSSKHDLNVTDTITIFNVISNINIGSSGTWSSSVYNNDTVKCPNTNGPTFNIFLGGNDNNYNIISNNKGNVRYNKPIKFKNVKTGDFITQCGTIQCKTNNINQVQLSTIDSTLYNNTSDWILIKYKH